MIDKARARTIVTSSGARQYQAIVNWQHRRGPADCLLRLHLAEGGPRMAVVSKIRSDHDERDIGSEFPSIAGEVLASLPSGFEVDPATVTWIAHYGEFSSYDAYAAPECFARVILQWDGTRYRGDLEGLHILKQEDADKLLAGVTLAPVPAVLRDLDRAY